MPSRTLLSPTLAAAIIAGCGEPRTRTTAGARSCYGFKVRPVPAVRPCGNFSSANSDPAVKLSDQQVLCPDADASNVCLPCQVGRGIGSMVHDAQAPGIGFTNTSSPGAHDRAAGTTLLQKGGDLFAGRSSASPDLHPGKAGMGNYNGTGSNGPCVACHMNSGSSHPFLPVTEPPSGKIPVMISRAGICCHNGIVSPSLESASLQAEKDRFAAGLAMLNGSSRAPGGLPWSGRRSVCRPGVPGRSSAISATSTGQVSRSGPTRGGSLLPAQLPTPPGPPYDTIFAEATSDAITYLMPQGVRP